MSYGTIEGTTWPVDTDDVQWKLRYAPNALTKEDRLFAASVMAAYAHLTDPMVDEESAIAALKRARLVTADVLANLAELQSERVKRGFVVMRGSGPSAQVFGPFTYDEAERWAKENGGGELRGIINGKVS